MHFKHHIEGRHILLLTDHKPLCSAFKSLKPAKSDRQQRHLSILTEYISDIAHIKGDQNVVADCLSRPANAVCLDICDLTEIAKQQRLDDGMQQYTDKLRSFELDDDLKLWCDTSLHYPRPCIPEPLRKTILTVFITYHTQALSQALNY